MTDCYEMSAFTEKGGRKSNCIPGLGVLLEGVTLISPMVVDINRHVFFKERKKALARQTTSLKNSTCFLNSVFVEHWTAHYENVQRGHYCKYSHRGHVTKHLISISAKAHSFPESCAGNLKDRPQRTFEKLVFSHKNLLNGRKNEEDMDVSGEIRSKAAAQTMGCQQVAGPN